MGSLQVFFAGFIGVFLPYIYIYIPAFHKTLRLIEERSPISGLFPQGPKHANSSVDWLLEFPGRTYNDTIAVTYVNKISFVYYVIICNVLPS